MIVNCMKPSEIMQVNGGTLDVALLSFTRMLDNEAKKFFVMETQREGMSWVALGSDGGSTVWNDFELEVSQAV